MLGLFDGKNIGRFFVRFCIDGLYAFIDDVGDVADFFGLGGKIVSFGHDAEDIWVPGVIYDSAVVELFSAGSVIESFSEFVSDFDVLR